MAGRLLTQEWPLGEQHSNWRLKHDGRWGWFHRRGLHGYSSIVRFHETVVAVLASSSSLSSSSSSSQTSILAGKVRTSGWRMTVGSYNDRQMKHVMAATYVHKVLLMPTAVYHESVR
jgi:hypothetical protein